MPCDGCDLHHRALYGCGCSYGTPHTPEAGGPSYEGLATVTYLFGADQEPWSRTCPRYYATAPHIAEIYSDLEDYRRGAMGDVDQLEHQLLIYLRAIDAAKNQWEAENMRQLSGGSK